MKRKTQIKLALFAMTESAVVLLYIGEDIMEKSSTVVKYTFGGLVVVIAVLCVLTIKDLIDAKEEGKS